MRTNGRKKALVFLDFDVAMSPVFLIAVDFTTAFFGVFSSVAVMRVTLVSVFFFVATSDALPIKKSLLVQTVKYHYIQLVPHRQACYHYW